MTNTANAHSLFSGAALLAAAKVAPTLIKAESLSVGDSFIEEGGAKVHTAERIGYDRQMVVVFSGKSILRLRGRQSIYLV